MCVGGVMCVGGAMCEGGVMCEGGAKCAWCDVCVCALVQMRVQGFDPSRNAYPFPLHPTVGPEFKVLIPPETLIPFPFPLQWVPHSHQPGSPIHTSLVLKG